MSEVHFGFKPSSEAPVNTEEDVVGSSNDSEMAKTRITELNSVVTMTVRQYEDFKDGAKQRHSGEVRVWKEAFRETSETLINDVKVAKADSGMMFVERNLILVRFEKNVDALRTLVNTNVDRMIGLTDVLSRIWGLFESCCFIDRLDYTVNILKLAREVQLLSGLAESKDLELQMVPSLVDEASYIWKEPSELKEKREPFKEKNKTVFAFRAEILESKARTGYIVGSLPEVNA